MLPGDNTSDALGGKNETANQEPDETAPRDAGPKRQLSFYDDLQAGKIAGKKGPNDKSRWLHDKPHVALGFLVAFFLVGYYVYVVLLEEEWTGRDFLYFSVVTITTVGYGDVLPTSDASKVFTIFYAAYGCAIAVISLMKVANYLIYKQKKLTRKMHEKSIKRLNTHMIRNGGSVASKRRGNWVDRLVRWLWQKLPASFRQANKGHVSKVSGMSIFGSRRAVH